MRAMRSQQILVVALIATVVLQIIYMVSLGGPQPAEPGAPTTGADVIRYFDERGSEVTTVWAIEAVAFLAIAVGAFLALTHGVAHKLALVALGLSGIFNTVQIGIGLAMFEPAARVGGDDPALFYTFVSGAFFFYFAAKALIGLAGLSLGASVLRRKGGLAKALGGLAALSGLAAIVANIAGMAVGFPALFAAGAAGTVATLFAALALGQVARES